MRNHPWPVVPHRLWPLRLPRRESPPITTSTPGHLLGPRRDLRHQPKPFPCCRRTTSSSRPARLTSGHRMCHRRQDSTGAGPRSAVAAESVPCVDTFHLTWHIAAFNFLISDTIPLGRFFLRQVQELKPHTRTHHSLVNS